MKSNKVLWVFCFIILLITLACYPFLPEQIPIHWNLVGEIDRYGGKWLIFLPVLLMMMGKPIFMLVVKMDPKRKNYERFQKSFEHLQLMFLLLILGLWLIILTASFYPKAIDVGVLVIILLSLVFMYLGNIMPKIKNNYFIGIRTPWTLQNETIWYRTHRFGGKLWFFGGALCLFAIWLPVNYRNGVLLVCMLLIALLPIVFSYILFKQQSH